jgi:multisubunit Na+/H+ antiporter MnhB subunit
MKVLLRIGSVLMWIVAAFLIYAVIHAMSSAGGAKTGVSIGYVAGAIILAVVGVWLWRLRAKPRQVVVS